MGLSKALALVQFTEGFRICKRINGRLESAFNQGVDKELPMDEWIDEMYWRKEDAPARVNFLGKDFKTYDYPVGWHIYTDKEEALWALDHLGRSYRDLVLVPVKMDKCIAYGEQSYRPNTDGDKRIYLKVVVCQKIKILHGVASIVL